MTLFELAERVIAPLPPAPRRWALRAGHVALQVFWLVRRPETQGVKVVVCQGDAVLLVRHTYGRRREWDLPGGFRNEDEEPATAARRELVEEVGVRGGDLRSLGWVSTRMGGRRDTVHAFSIQAPDRSFRLDEGEIAEARWFAHDELPERVALYTRRFVARAYWELFRG